MGRPRPRKEKEMTEQLWPQEGDRQSVTNERPLVFQDSTQSALNPVLSQECLSILYL